MKKYSVKSLLFLSVSSFYHVVWLVQLSNNSRWKLKGISLLSSFSLTSGVWCFYEEKCHLESQSFVKDPFFFSLWKVSGSLLVFSVSPWLGLNGNLFPSTVMSSHQALLILSVWLWENMSIFGNVLSVFLFSF